MRIGKFLINVNVPEAELKAVAEFVNQNVKILEKIVLPEAVLFIGISVLFNIVDEKIKQLPEYVVKKRELIVSQDAGYSFTFERKEQ